jgi:hypothetical protein
MCSIFSREQHEDPIGTAGEYDLYVIMELPLPWARDAWDSPRLPDGLGALAARAQALKLNVRQLAIQPDPEYSEPGRTRIFTYRRPTGSFAHYAKSEYIVPSNELIPVMGTLLDIEAGLPAADLHGYRRESSHIREMLLCTHGTRDACCGKFGYSIYSLLRHVHAPAMEGKMRAWRVSHLGGHRFAPNLLDFPEGRYWARLDKDAVEAILLREKAVTGLHDHYRGWSGLDPLCQVAEREILMREGWAWTNYLTAGDVLEWDEGGETAVVRIEYADPSRGISGAYEAVIEKSGTLPMITCLSDEPARQVDQYRVRSLVKAVA